MDQVDLDYLEALVRFARMNRDEMDPVALAEVACLPLDEVTGNIASRATDALGTLLMLRPDVTTSQLMQVAGLVADGELRDKYVPFVAQSLAFHPNADGWTRDRGVVLLADYLTGRWWELSRPFPGNDGWRDTALEIAGVLLSSSPAEMAQMVSNWRSRPGDVSWQARGRLLVAVASA